MALKVPETSSQQNVAMNIQGLMKNAEDKREKERKAKVPKPVPALGGILGGIGGAGAGLPKKTKIAELDKVVEDIKTLQSEFKRVKELKGMIDCGLKIQGTLDNLKEAQDHLQAQDAIGLAIGEQPNFIEEIRQIQQYIDDISYQVARYLDANILKKKFVEDDMRKKVKGLSENLHVSNTQIKVFYLHPISQSHVSDVYETNQKISEALLASMSSFQPGVLASARGQSQPDE